MNLFFVTDAALAGDIDAILRRAGAGRWHLKGYPCIYACTCEWQCLVEYILTVPLLKRPKELAITAIEVPDDSVTMIRVSQLSPGWDRWPRPVSARQFGTDLLLKCETLLLVFPSATGKEKAVVYVINAKHPKMKEVKVLWTEKYTLDATKFRKL